MEKPNKRKADLERTRQIILSVASELFMTKGFKNTSTREIALKANITQPNLYHHFKNKKELYLAVIEELTSRVQEELVPIVSGNASVEEKLYQLIKVLLDEHPTNLFLMLNDMCQEMKFSITIVRCIKFSKKPISIILRLFLKVNLKPIAYKRASV